MIRNNRMKKPEESKSIKADFYASIHNRFDIEVIDSKTGKVKQKAKAENVICQAYWDFIFNYRSNVDKTWFTSICFGEGTGTPTSTDTSLFSYVGYGTVNSKINWNRNLSGHYCYCKKFITLTETQFVGESFTEVGIGTSSTLYTHAMIQDMNGNQISIVKSDTDIITIYATVFLHYPPEYDTRESSIQIFHTTSSYCFFNWLTGQKNSSSDGEIGHFSIYPTKNRLLKSDVIIGQVPSSSESGGKSISTDAENKTIKAVCSRVPVGESNIGGIRFLIISMYYYYYSLGTRSENIYPWLAIKVQDDWFPKSQITGEALGTGDGVTVDFKTAFDFPLDARVFVDGVEDTTAIVENIGCFYTTGYNKYLDVIEVVNDKIYPYSQERDGWYTYENSNYKNGIEYFEIYNGQYDSAKSIIECSNDGIVWENVSRSYSSSYHKYYPTEAQRHYKYWRSKQSLSSYPFNCYLKSSTNVHFTNPPPVGAVITIDYKTETIPKDENHVFDMEMTIHLGDYIV